MKPQALFIAQPTYAAEINGNKVWGDLQLAAEEASKLAAELASHGYELGRQDLLNGGEKQDIEKTLDEWFAHVADGSCVIFFWTGHGHSDGGKHYLVCRNSPKGGISPFNALDTGAIGPVIANCKAEKILVVLDTCYSGLGAGEMVDSLGKVLATRTQVVGQQRAFAIIASAHPLEEAKEGILSSALRTALLEPNIPPDKRRWTDHDQFINSSFLSKASRLLMSDDVSSPQYMAHGDDQDFIPNPRYQGGLPAENVEERLWRLSRADAAEHFELAARGIEVGESGWFFSGRKRLLGALVDWLNTAEHGVRIVTGPPGAGKSAVMGRLATLSDAQYRQEAIDAGVVKEGEDVIPPVGSIDVAVHAKGKTLDDCARALGKGLGIETDQDVSVDLERLVADISNLDRKITLMADALDEAAGGQGAVIATGLIVPLGSLPRVRVLVGTRRSLDGAVIPEGEDRHGRLHAAFGADAIIDDLEDEPETQDDIAAYVRLRLGTSAKHRGDAPESLAYVADRVAVQAQGIFLYARIVSRTLQDRDQLVGDLPATALEAFEQDLSTRFEGEERRVDDLLGALAWGEGKGLTRRVWPLIANTLAGRERPYDDDDIAWVLGHAGWHIIEAGEDGQTVYRLAHQALADHYHDKADETETQGRIVDELHKGINGAGWLDCDKYLWRHLADHAAKSGRLDALIRDPGYLAVADPARLVVALRCVKSRDGRRFADIYDRVVDRLIGQSVIDRMPHIHLTALIEDPDIAPILEPPVQTRWRCRWARVKPSTPHRVIGRHNATVNSVAFALIDGVPVVVSGGGDGIIRRWDARTGRPIGEPLEAHKDSVKSVAIGVIDGEPAIVSVGAEGTIRRWDARTGRPIDEPLGEWHARGANSVAFGVIDGKPVIVSGSRWRIICRWDARTGRTMDNGRDLIERSWIPAKSVAFGMVDGVAVIVSGSRDGTVRRWDARTCRPIGKPLTAGRRAPVSSVAFGMIDGAPVIVSGGEDSAFRRWDARTGRPIGEPLKGHGSLVDSVAFGVIDGKPVIVSGSRDGIVRSWDARAGQPIGTPLAGHEDWVTAVAFGVIDSAPIIVSGSRDGTVRGWDARASRPVGEPLEAHKDSVKSVACGVVDGASVIVSGSADKTVRRWNARTGLPIGAALEGHGDWVTSVAFGVIDGAPVIVSGSWDDTIRRWDARTGQQFGDPRKVHRKSLASIAFGVIDGKPVIVSGGNDKAIRRWDARTGRSVGEPLTGHRNRVNSVGCGVIDGAPVIISGSADKTIRRWDARTGLPIGEPLKGHGNWVASVAFGAIDGKPVIVSGSWDNTIRRWDAHTGLPIGAPLEGHGNLVRSVAFRVIDDTPVIVSAGDDNTLRFWDARTGDQHSVLAIGERVSAIDMDDSGEVIVGMQRGIVLFDFFTGRQR
jgi:WD40 repeat protein